MKFWWSPNYTLVISRDRNLIYKLNRIQVMPDNDRCSRETQAQFEKQRTNLKTMISLTKGNQLRLALVLVILTDHVQILCVIFF